MHDRCAIGTIGPDTDTELYFWLENTFRTTPLNRSKGSSIPWKLMFQIVDLFVEGKKRETNLYRAIAHCRIIKEACFSTWNGFPRNRYGGKSTRRNLFYSSLRYLCQRIFFITIFFKIVIHAIRNFFVDENILLIELLLILWMRASILIYLHKSK